MEPAAGRVPRAHPGAGHAGLPLRPRTPRREAHSPCFPPLTPGPLLRGPSSFSPAPPSFPVLPCVPSRLPGPGLSAHTCEWLPALETGMGHEVLRAEPVTPGRDPGRAAAPLPWRAAVLQDGACGETEATWTGRPPFPLTHSPGASPAQGDPGTLTKWHLPSE